MEKKYKIIHIISTHMYTCSCESKATVLLCIWCPTIPFLKSRYLFLYLPSSLPKNRHKLGNFKEQSKLQIYASRVAMAQARTNIQCTPLGLSFTLGSGWLEFWVWESYGGEFPPSNPHFCLSLHANYALLTYCLSLSLCLSVN